MKELAWKSTLAAGSAITVPMCVFASDGVNRSFWSELGLALLPLIILFVSLYFIFKNAGRNVNSINERIVESNERIASVLERIANHLENNSKK